MLLMAIFALAIYAEEQDTLDKAKFQAAVPYNQAVEIHFGEKTKMPTEYTQDKGDVSVAQNGKIHAYAADDGKYYIAHEEDGTIYFPEDSGYLFSDFDIEKPKEYTKLTSITFDHIDTSKVTTMNGMFEGCESLEKLDLSNFNTSKVIEMGRMFNGCFDLTELDLSSFDTSEVRNMEWMFAGCHALKTLDLSNFNTSNVTRMGFIFYVCKTLTELDLSSFDTNNVIDMQYMFKECNALKELDVSNFNTSKVTRMQYMFYGCNGLKELDLSSFDTSDVTDMSVMFAGCNGLKKLDLSKFNTVNVTDMSGMFNRCHALEKLDLSSFDTSKVTDMGHMFSECTNLTTIYASENFNTDSITMIDADKDMFKECKSLVGGKGTGYVEGNTDKEYARIDGGADAPGYFTEKGSTLPSVVTDTLDKKKFHKAVPGAKAVEIHFGAKKDKPADYTTPKGDVSVAQNGKIRAYATADGTKYYIAHEEDGTICFPKDSEYLFSNEKIVQHYTKLNKITFNDHIDTSDVVNMAGMFYGCESLETLDLSKFNTSNVVNMAAMFNGCKSLKTLDVSEFNTSNVANMVGMFKECKALTSITFNDHIDTSNVTNMANMFEGCSALKELDVSKFNTSEVTRMDDMFNGCKSLKELKLSSFNTSKVTRMDDMFNGCKSLKTLDVSKFDTSNVTDMKYMFAECEALTTLDVSKFDTSNVTDMKYMFARCEALTTLDVSKFDTSNVTDMESMFWSCKALTELDLSSFNTSNVTNIKSMFLGCIKLKTIYASENFNTDNIMIEAGKDVFEHCTQLEGGKGTKYNASHIGKEYARIDGGTSKPGYFIQKGSTPPSTYHSVTVNVNVDENGTATATPNSAVQGTKITIEAIAKPNYKFVKWEGINGLELTYGNINTAIVKFTMPDKDVTVKAIFEPIPSTTHTIRFESNGGSGSMEAVTVGHGKNYTLPKCEFKAPEGKEFDHWEVKGTAYNAGGQITDIKSDLTIKAVWKKKSSGGSSGGGSSSGSSKKTDNTVKQEQPSSQTPQPSSDSNLAENPAENNIIKKQQTTVFTIGSNIMTVMEDGKSKQTTIDAKSFISQGRTMIPVRYVAESMGMKVEWDKKTMTVILKNKEMTVKIPVKTDKIIVIKADGTKQEYTSDIKPIVKNGRTYLPISNIAKVLDLKPGEGIKWDNNTKQVTIVKQIDIH